ncbi:MAG: thiol:disulfide interchange protein DsbA/DsbL, partial [Gammaproteobacteria bacterium]|nr:thiol:disulfide interchange protein DsbA/DsbL [Gammaproteobacteria bacterium]
ILHRRLPPEVATMKPTKLLVWTTMLLISACGTGDQSDLRESRAPEAGGLEAPAETEAERGAAEEAAASERFQLGTHYQRLTPTQPTSSGPERVEVAEVFWYGCPHCYTFEPYLARWQETKPDYVSFVRIPAVWNPLVELHARAFYTAAALGKGEEMHDAFFAEIHERGALLDSKDALAEFFGRFGVDREAFESAFESFDVHTQVQRAEELSRRYRIESVPSVVVNGKYTANASMAGGYEELIALIDELAASERPANR